MQTEKILAVISDQGDRYQILGTRSVPHTEIYDEDKFVEINDETKETIDQELSTQNMFISKEEVAMLKENAGKDFNKIDFVYNKIDSLLKEKTYAFSLCRSTLQN